MRFYETILRYPKSVVALILLVTLFFGWHARKVELNNSIEELLPQGHPSVIQDKELKHVFNSREMILIGVVREDGIFNPTTLRKVKELTERAWQITVAGPEDERSLAVWGETGDAPYRDRIRDILSGGITVADRAAVNNLLIAVSNDDDADSAFASYLGELHLKLSPLSDVLSIAAVDNITSSEFGLDVTPPMETVPRTDEELTALAATMFDNEMFVDLIVSGDSTATLLLAELAFYYDDRMDLAHRVFQELEVLARPYEGPERIYLAGVPMVNVYTTTSMSGDMVKLTPLVILLVMAVMYLSFRMARGVFIPLSVVLAAVVWTLGIMGLLGRPITMIVSMMPVMLIAIGIADGIHLITEYKLLWAELRDRDQAILGTMRQLTAPVVLTSLTTMAGFGALATSSLRSIRDFGIFTSVGVFAAMIFSLTFVPAALRLMAPPRRGAEGVAYDRLTRWLGRFAGLVVRRRRRVYVGVVALAAVSVAAILQITVGSTMVAMFKNDSAIVKASEMINEKFGGIEVMNIVVDTRIDDGLKDPTVLAKIAALQDTLEALPVVGYTSSLADYVKRTNLVMHDNDQAFNRIPRVTEVVREPAWTEDGGGEGEVTREVEVAGRDLIAQYVLLYENAGGNDLEKLADFDYSKANIVVMIRDDFTPNLKTVMDRAKAFTRDNFGGDIEVIYAGCSTLCVVADDLIIPGQMRSLGIAFVVVLLLLAVIFRSAGYGIMGLLPMVLTVLLVFMLLGAFGVYLDAATALVASIVLGIGVDYSVHFLSRYRSLRSAGLAFPEAVRGTMVTSGRAIVFNSLAVAVGFLVLLLSSFWPVIHIGWLVSVNMVFSAILTMGLLPGVLSSWGGQLEAAGARAGVRSVDHMASVRA
jgi:predicted RND superfamily exporter protein